MAKMNYDDMLAYAKAIHPDAKISHGGEYSIWKISIPTEFEVETTLPKCFKDTPAWAKVQQFDSDYGNALIQWAHDVDKSYLPIDAVAEFYNLTQERNDFYRMIMDEALMVELGADFNFDDLDNDSFSAYKNIQRRSIESADEFASNALTAFNAKWEASEL